jgi:hypothetical protein
VSFVAYISILVPSGIFFCNNGHGLGWVGLSWVGLSWVGLGTRHGNDVVGVLDMNFDTSISTNFDFDYNLN